MHDEGHALQALTASRYVVPLREGGTLPAIVEADNGTLWVVKFRGAGQGARALIAEVLAAEMARALELPVPDLVRMEIPDALGRGERDPEIQDLLHASRGANVAMAYLEGAFNYDHGAAAHLVPDSLATALVWFDALILNPDRTPRNPNLLLHDGRPWMIDHGAALYPHFNWAEWDDARTRDAVGRIADHVLLGRADDLRSVDHPMRTLLMDGGLDQALARIPDVWLEDPLLAGEFESAEQHRARYKAFLLARLAPGPSGHPSFVEAAEKVRVDARTRPLQPLLARR
jgi:hypothetical protein